MLTKRPNMDRTGPRIYENGAVHLNIDFETPGYIKIYQIVLYTVNPCNNKSVVTNSGSRFPNLLFIFEGLAPNLIWANREKPNHKVMLR